MFVTIFATHTNVKFSFVWVYSLQLRLQLLISSLVKVQLLLVAILVGFLSVTNLIANKTFNANFQKANKTGLDTTISKLKWYGSCRTSLSFCLFSTIWIVNLRSDTWWKAQALTELYRCVPISSVLWTNSQFCHHVSTNCSISFVDVYMSRHTCFSKFSLSSSSCFTRSWRAWFWELIFENFMMSWN